VEGGDKADTIKSMSDIISNPIEQAHPIDVAFGAKKLNQRQQRILDMLPEYGSQAVVNKRDVSMIDLAALTANTSDEYVMFTRRGKRLVARGDRNGIHFTFDEIAELKRQGYRWSGHTHPGFTEAHLIASDGDKRALVFFEQGNSVIYNSLGRYALIYPKE